MIYFEIVICLIYGTTTLNALFRLTYSFFAGKEVFDDRNTKLLTTLAVMYILAFVIWMVYLILRKLIHVAG